MRRIGIDVEPPKKSCTDELCPFHGKLSIRGRLIKGKAVSVKAKNTVVVEKEYLHYIPKYMRYERRRSKIHAHLPPCIDVKEGDTLQIAECRPLAKSVAFVVISKESE
ncbi:MAG: 30S ribosomal protein S17 [Thaumarchaeota archaeon]|jgi:small subunit ribosomal protein S17|nr:30S ribosomal protein S17 [Nitrososphaerota archaeon]